MKKTLLVLASSFLLLTACGGGTPASSESKTSKEESTSNSTGLSSSEEETTSHSTGLSSSEEETTSHETGLSSSEEESTSHETGLSSSEEESTSHETGLSSSEEESSSEEISSEEESSSEEISSSEEASSSTVVTKSITYSSISVYEDEGSPILSIQGTYEGYTDDEFEELPYYLDFESNSWYIEESWGHFERYMKNAPIEVTALDGDFGVEIDISSLEPYAYQIHFGLDKTEVTDLKFDTNFHTSVQIGNYQYELISDKTNPDDGKKFWGLVGLVITDTSLPYQTIESADIAVNEDKVLVSYMVSYGNQTYDELIALDWHGDFQLNANINKDGKWDRNKPELSWAEGEEGYAIATYEVTAFEAKSYTCHFGIGVNESGDNKGQAKDIKLSQTDKTVRVGPMTYMLDFDNNAFWGNVGLVVTNTGLPTQKITGGDIAIEEGKVIVAWDIEYDKQSFDELIALDWAADFQLVDVWSSYDMDIEFVNISNGHALAKMDVTSLGGVGNGTYINHFGVRVKDGDTMKTPDNKAAGDDKEVSLNGKTYKLDMQNYLYWGLNSIVIRDENAPYYETTTVNVFDIANVPTIEFVIRYVNMSDDEIKALPWKGTVQNNGNTYGAGGWTVYDLDLEPGEARDGRFTFTADLSSLKKGNYYIHFGTDTVGNNDLKINGHDSEKIIADKKYNLKYGVSDNWECVSLFVEEPTVYTVTDLPDWIANDGAMVFSHVWNNDGYTAWHLIELGAETITFPEFEAITGCLFVRTVAGTETPDWSQREDVPGKILNKTRDITIEGTTISAPDQIWMEYNG